MTDILSPAGVQQVVSSNLSLIVSRFSTAMPDSPAYGYMQTMKWADFTALVSKRREGNKDGPNVVLARFKPESDGRARRLKANVLSRTAVALDCEADKKTGEIPPGIDDVVSRIRAQGWTAAVYTSHNHSVARPRYRIVIPLTREIEPGLPAPEVAALTLGLSGVLDRSKLGPASVFYLPSTAPGRLAEHETVAIEGAAITAEWIRERGNALLAIREAEQARIRAEAMAAAEGRRAARAAAGFKPAEKLIEGIRDRLDLEGELLGHGYAKQGDRYLYPESETGIPGVHVLAGSDGVLRVYSHHGGDPLASGNLPPWCTVKAIDVVDLVTILDFGADRKKALHELARRFGIGQAPADAPDTTGPECAFQAKPATDLRRKAIARAAFKLLRMNVASDVLLATLHEMNEQQNDPLPPDIVANTAVWAARQSQVQSRAR